MGELEKCPKCGEPIPLFAAPLGDTAVIKGKCQKCHPNEVDVFHVPNPESNDNDQLRQTPESENQVETDDREKLTRGNIRKVESGDRIEFRDDDGCIRVLKVTNHVKSQGKVTGWVKKNGNSEKVYFDYNQLLDKNGQVLFEYPDMREHWENRFDMPIDYQVSDSDNEKTFLEAVKRGYIQIVNFISTTMEEVSKLLTKTTEFCLAQAAGFVRDVTIAAWKTFFYVTWKHRTLKEKLTNGEITRGQYEAECNEYRKYFGKTAMIVVCARPAAYGVRKLLMTYVPQVVMEELEYIWTQMGLPLVQIRNLSMKAMSIIHKQLICLFKKVITARSPPVQALTWLCTIFPNLGSFVAFVGGPETFLAIGAISLIAAGGLILYYTNRKFINKTAIKQLSSEISAETTDD